jgi:hypothetical protein
MKNPISLGAFNAYFVVSICTVLIAVCARAGLISYGGFADSGNIADGSVTGTFGTATVDGYASTVSDVSVRLNVSGGFNGDLYAYLSHGDVLVPLLNRVGVTGTGGGSAFGYANSGFDITLSSSALGVKDLHLYGNYDPGFNGNGQLTGTWQPDGRTLDPLSSPGSFDSAERVSFRAFDGVDPNGQWTLFFADLSAGDQSRLVSWELDLTVVPEPVNVALGCFAGLFVAVAVVRNWRARKVAGGD